MGKYLRTGILAFAMLGLSFGANAMPLAGGNMLSKGSGSDVVRIQAATPELQIQQLEETVRDLNGRVEELNFQVLQMQEQMRKIQEDNEFRFQELEKSSGKKSGSLTQPAAEPNEETAGATAPAGSTDELAGAAGSAATIENQTEENAELESVQPGTLGSLIFNGDGEMIVKHNPDAGAEEENGSLPGVDVATLPKQEDAGGLSASEEDAYQAAYSLILSGDYVQAEQGFKGYLDSYPEGARAADAAFWLGEAQYSQGNYNEAAQTFLDTYKTYGTSPKAPEVLLKLGMTLAALDNRETACATLAEIPKRFPKASKTVIGKVGSEQARLGC